MDFLSTHTCREWSRSQNGLFHCKEKLLFLFHSHKPKDQNLMFLKNKNKTLVFFLLAKEQRCHPAITFKAIQISKQTFSPLGHPLIKPRSPWIFPPHAPETLASSHVITSPSETNLWQVIRGWHSHVQGLCWTCLLLWKVCFSFPALFHDVWPLSTAGEGGRCSTPEKIRVESWEPEDSLDFNLTWTFEGKSPQVLF